MSSQGPGEAHAALHATFEEQGCKILFSGGTWFVLVIIHASFVVTKHPPCVLRDSDQHELPMLAP